MANRRNPGRYEFRVNDKKTCPKLKAKENKRHQQKLEKKPFDSAAKPKKLIKHLMRNLVKREAVPPNRILRTPRTMIKFRECCSKALF